MGQKLSQNARSKNIKVEGKDNPYTCLDNRKVNEVSEAIQKSYLLDGGFLVDKNGMAHSGDTFLRNMSGDLEFRGGQPKQGIAHQIYVVLSLYLFLSHTYTLTHVADNCSGVSYVCF